MRCLQLICEALGTAQDQVRLRTVTGKLVGKLRCHLPAQLTRLAVDAGARWQLAEREGLVSAQTPVAAALHLLPLPLQLSGQLAAWEWLVQRCWLRLCWRAPCAPCLGWRGPGRLQRCCWQAGLSAAYGTGLHLCKP